MSVTIKGSFDVQRHVEPGYDMGDGVELGHFRFEKRFHGALDATSVVHMLAVGTPVQGSAAYVAIERVNGTLEGLRGTFFLQHNGVMERGEGTLALTVVPDSGTGELSGLTGSMKIDIDNGAHFYTFDYALSVTDDASA